MNRKFLVHEDGDFVGVAVEDIAAGETVVGAFMGSKAEVRVKSRADIPLGHKIALRGIKKGEKVLEYHEVIGSATQDIKEGDHVHTHNLRSLRWT